MSRIYFNSKLLDVWKNQKNCDVHFNFPEKNSQKIGAHTWALSLASDVFDVMFYGESTQQGHFSHEKPICITDIDPIIFNMFLGFIYGERVKLETACEAVDFYSVAHKYNCIDAMNFGKRHMKNAADKENGILFYEASVLFDISDLKETCLKIFSTETLDILNGEQFLNALPETVKEIFALENVKINSEMDFINALEAYIKHNEKADPNIKEKIQPALKCIRFLTLTTGQVAKCTLLNAEEVRLMVIYLSFPDDLNELPAGFSVSKRKRPDVTLFKPLMNEISTIQKKESKGFLFDPKPRQKNQPKRDFNFGHRKLPSPGL